MEWFKSLKTIEMVQIIGIGLTFLIGLVNFIFNIFNNKKIIFINTITNKRVEWINQLRECISDYISLASTYPDKQFYEIGKTRRDYLDKVEKTNSQIKLYLNFAGDIDGKIIELIDEIKSCIYMTYEILAIIEDDNFEIDIEEAKDYLARMGEEDLDLSVNQNQISIAFYNTMLKKLKEIKESFNNHITDLTMHTQIYLKLEWNRVKKEAQKGKYRDHQMENEKKKLYEIYNKLWGEQSQ